MAIKDIFCNIFHWGNKTTTPLHSAEKSRVPALVENRKADNKAVVIFVHGFHGEATATWESFVRQLLSDYRLSDWDVYSAGYSSGLSIDLPIWTSDPGIEICATGLVTKLRHPPLDRYKAIALVAHSMGGLVVQRAILDCDELREKRISHVVLYGTPSSGVSKAILGSRLKSQARAMCVGGTFIKRLREEWQEIVGEHPSFSFTAVAGETDAFIPASSSIDPFPKTQQAVVPGNHLEIVRPDSTEHLSYSLFYRALSNSLGAVSAVESARLAVEHKEFECAIELLMPGLDGIDANAIVTLALALESVGRKDEAIDVIERWNHSHEGHSLDAIGVLAGRLKRRWLVSRQQQDLDRALELYSAGLEAAESSVDHDQAHYHGINLAFLRLVSAPGDGQATSEVKDLARRALRHVEGTNKNQWAHATRGEAYLILGDLDTGVGAYREARRLAKNLRECDSMHMQAVAVAMRIFGVDSAKRIDEIFGLSQGADSR